jgi:hypothetical protein
MALMAISPIVISNRNCFFIFLIDIKINDGAKMKMKEAANARTYESELFR